MENAAFPQCAAFQPVWLLPKPDILIMLKALRFAYKIGYKCSWR